MNDDPFVVVDAERYRFIRDYLAQKMDARMDGTFIFRVRSPRGRAASFDCVIDNMMNELGEFRKLHETT